MSLYVIAAIIFFTKNINANNMTINCELSDLFDSNHIVKLSADVEFHLYTRRNLHESYILQPHDLYDLQNSPFNKKNKTVIFIHGFAESVTSPTPQKLKHVYLKHHAHNIILVNWKELAVGPWYYSARENVKIVGPHIANFVKWLENENATVLSELHVIGYSLGAHIAGFMGKALAPKKVGRITGLDPAGPTYNNAVESRRLDKSDALFVDIIHTSGNRLGLRKPVGHADFYPNLGDWQPGCNFIDFRCSHNRARAYYIESIMKPYGFPAKKCREWQPIIKNCASYPDTHMGINADSKTHGIFLLNTNDKSPFARYLNDYRHMNIAETVC